MKYYAVAIGDQLLDIDGNICTNSADAYKGSWHTAMTLVTMYKGSRIVGIEFTFGQEEDDVPYRN